MHAARGDHRSQLEHRRHRIEFNLPGQAPVTIALSNSTMSLIQDRTGGTTIDGYTQPGSRINTSTTGSNAIPGVVLRGTGNNPQNFVLYVSCANNVIRGIDFINSWHGVMLDTTNAHNNSIVGDWFGMTASGGVDSYSGHDGVIINNGANHNKIGSPALADVNVSRASKALYLYGQGTDYNVLQNNFLCMTPSGTSTAPCSTGIDHDFGPKNNLEGGTNANERNVIGATYLNGIEISHGYDRGHTTSADPYQNKYNQLIGNWIGFRGDGSYSSSFASAQSNPGSGDNGNAINIYDGSSYNVASGNYISSIWDGIQTASPNSTGNTISGNFIGLSPFGQPAPVGRDGIVVRLQTRTHTVVGNTITNIGRYGIALLQKDVLYVKVSKNVDHQHVRNSALLRRRPVQPEHRRGRTDPRAEDHLGDHCHGQRDGDRRRDGRGLPCDATRGPERPAPDLPGQRPRRIRWNVARQRGALRR